MSIVYEKIVDEEIKILINQKILLFDYIYSFCWRYVETRIHSSLLEKNKNKNKKIVLLYEQFPIYKILTICQTQISYIIHNIFHNQVVKSFNSGKITILSLFLYLEE